MEQKLYLKYILYEDKKVHKRNMEEAKYLFMQFLQKTCELIKV